MFVAMPSRSTAFRAFIVVAVISMATISLAETLKHSSGSLTSNKSAITNSDSVDDQSISDMVVYPLPADGFQRFVFRVPPVHNEDRFDVEIIVGKSDFVRGNYSTFYSGDLTTEISHGSGAVYYVLGRVKRRVVRTSKIPPRNPNYKPSIMNNIMEFVTVQGAGFIRSYDSKLPFVTYAPKGFDVRYKILDGSHVIRSARTE